MKTTQILAITTVMLALGFSACTKNDDSANPPATGTANIVQQGPWRVTLYSSNGTDEVNHFTGYLFTFNSNGTVAAVNNSSSINGTWNPGTDDSQQKLYLNFGTSLLFEDINDDWHILEKTSTKIRLEDVSGGNGGTDLLTFEKN